MTMNIVVYKGPITDTIYAARIGKRGDTLEKWDVTNDVISAVVQLLEKKVVEVSRGKHGTDGYKRYEIKLEELRQEGDK